MNPIFFSSSQTSHFQCESGIDLSMSMMALTAFLDVLAPSHLG